MEVEITQIGAQIPKTTNTTNHFKQLTTSLLLTAVFATVEILGAISCNSIAIMTEASCLVVDGLGIGLLIFA